MKSRDRAIRDHFRSAWRRLMRFVEQRTVIALSIILILLIGFGSVLFDEFEPNLSSGIWRSYVYALSGNDVDAPTTLIGRWTAATVIAGGVILTSFITGYVASEFSRLMASSSSIQIKPPHWRFENHVIFFGWNAKTKAVLQQLNSEYESNPYLADDYVIISEDEWLPKGDEAIYENVWQVRGAPTDTDILRRADLPPHRGRGARVAAIISDPSLDEEEAERRSILKLLAVEHLYPDVISLVEVLREKDKIHFDNAYADQVILPRVYGSYLMARTSEFPGMAAFVDELLALSRQGRGAASHDTRKAVSFAVRSASQLGVVGKSLKEAILHYYRTKRGIITGYADSEGVRLYPDLVGSGKTDPSRVLSANDHLMVLVHPQESAV